MIKSQSQQVVMTLVQRRVVALGMVSMFKNAVEDDLYPNSVIEGVFGVKMSTGSSGVFDVRPGLERMPTGKLVFNCWITLRLHSSRDEDSLGISDANIISSLITNNMPALFEQSIRALRGDNMSHYTFELVRRGFESIPWDREMLAALAGLPFVLTSRVAETVRRFGIGELHAFPLPNIDFSDMVCTWCCCPMSVNSRCAKCHVAK